MSSNSVLEEEADEKGAIYWEEADEGEERGKAAWASFRELEDEQSSWRESTMDHLRMYRNIEMMGYGGRRGEAPIITRKQPLSLNVVRNMVNAVHSRITRHRVKSFMQTKGAGWEAKQRALDAEAFGTAMALKGGLYKKTPMAFMDTAVTGTGVIKTYASKAAGEPVFERVFSPNLVVDFAEGCDITITPAHFYEVKYVSKRVLVKRAEKAEKGEELIKKIKSLPTAAAGDGDSFYALQESQRTDRVRVVECLYLNPDDENDGILSIVANGLELDGGKWEQGNPYSTMRWANSPLGWYGMGLAEELKGIQLEINRLVRKIQTSMGLLGNPYIFADRSSNIARTHMTDLPGTFILYNGKPPTIGAPQTVHPEMFAHLDRLYQRAYEIAGISQLSAHGEKPAGIESGRAMLVYDDMQNSDRFANVHAEWSQLHVDAIAKGIRCTRALKSYSVPIYGSETHTELKHKDLNLEGDDSWVIFPMPASLLGDTPAAQLDKADKLKSMGVIDDPSEWLAELASPDEAAMLRRKSSPKVIIEMTIGRMLSGGHYMPPEPQDNLALALDISNQMYQEARRLDYPQDRLAKVRDYMVECRDQLAKAASQPPTTGATMPAIAPQELPPPMPAGPPQGAPPAPMMQ